MNIPGPHRPRTHGPAADDRGFTLLELIVVLFLMVLILSFSAAFFANSLPGGVFSASVRDMTAAMRLTRSLAQMKGTGQTLTINLDERSYKVADRSPRRLPDTVQIKVIDPVAGDVTTGSYEIIFPAVGGAEGGTVVLWNKTKTVQISLDPVAGSAVVKPQ